MATYPKSVFQQMHEGTRHSEGSFNTTLYNLFLLGTQDKRETLIKAFPTFFNQYDYYMSWFAIDTLEKAQKIIKWYEAQDCVSDLDEYKYKIAKEVEAICLADLG